MTAEVADPRLRDVLVSIVFQQRVTAPDADAGIACLAASTARLATDDEWRAAVGEALADGLIHDPVRLPAGALQCHWHLELTPAGVETARRIRGRSDNA